MNGNLIALVKKFQIEGIAAAVSPIGSGHIHDSYLVSTLQPETPDYLLQRINHKVFPNISDLTGNILRVTSHLQQKLGSCTGQPFQVIRLIPVTGGGWWLHDSDGNHWRMYEYIAGSRCYDRLENPDRAFQAGFAFGTFQALTADMDTASLVEILPCFHHVGKRLRQFREALLLDRAGRAGQVAAEILTIGLHANEMQKIMRLVEDGQIPVRVTHNDTKCNNILFDEQNRAIAVIDLDTVMPGTTLYDFGDAIRTGASTAAEDETDTSRIGIDMNLFEAYSKGYLQAVRHILTPTEIDHLSFSARVMTYTIGLRFLTDYLDGDRYYKISSSDHNLRRARAQFRLLASMEEHATLMNAIIRKTAR